MGIEVDSVRRALISVAASLAWTTVAATVPESYRGTHPTRAPAAWRDFALELSV